MKTQIENWGYYDTKAEAQAAGREKAIKKQFRAYYSWA